MDTGHSYNFSQQDNYTNGSSHFLHCFLEHSTPSASMQSSEFPSDPESPQCFFAPPNSASSGFSSTPLVDYTVFNTPVDISLGVLPPRPTTSRALSQGRIPRPRNAFMLFRSTFNREKRLAKSVEKDHRHISRIIGLCWAELSEADKDVWRQKAELEKQQHALAYPDYRFRPTPRTKQAAKRNVKRNTPKEIERCQKIARLLQDGKSGEELTHAVRRMEGELPPTQSEGGTAPGACEERRPKKQKALHHVQSPTSHFSPGPPDASQPQLNSHMPSDELPPFRSPLLPPSIPPEISSKRPYPAAVAGPLSSPTTSHVGSCNNLYFAENLSEQAYIPYQLDRDAKHRQLPREEQQEVLGWSIKDFQMTPYDVAFKQQYGVSDPPCDSHCASFYPKGHIHAPYTPGSYSVPGAADWSTYYRGDTTRGPMSAAAAIPSANGSWSNSDTNASISSVHSDSPITPL